MMTPIYLNPPTSPFPFVEQKEENDHHPVQFFVTSPYQSSSPCSTLFSKLLDQSGKRNPIDDQSKKYDQKVYEYISHGESSDHNPRDNDNYRKISIIKQEHEVIEDIRSGNGSVKWMSSKMRLMRKMINSNYCSTNLKGSGSVELKHHRDHYQHDNSEMLKNNNNNNIIRVCSDCNTTKTPLWRSGPRGPKSLCNACGIRQRKARRAMEAMAANGGIALDMDGEGSSSSTPKMSTIKFINKVKKFRTSYHKLPHQNKKPARKQFQVEDDFLPDPESNDKNICFEHFALNLLGKN